MADHNGSAKKTGIIDDLFGDSDTSVSSSSGDEEKVVSNNELYVLQLHDIKRDGSATPASKEKPQRRSKRKKSKDQDKAKSQIGSNSDSESSAGTEDTAKEEFFDAQGSNNAIEENPSPLAAPLAAAVAPVQGAALVIAHSEHGQELKTTDQTPALPASDSAIPLALSSPVKTITKPSQWHQEPFEF